MERIVENGSVVLVTGAGSGIGRAVATVLARAGHRVYAGLRGSRPEGAEQVAALRRIADDEGLDLRAVEMDVLSEESCRAAVEHVFEESDRLDVVVNNAGMLMVGVTEAFTPAQLQRIFDTNATSWLRVNRAALPAMRRQGSGTLVYVSSTTAHLAEPFLGPYVASKAAGEALAEVMGFEVRPFGIDTIIVVPGAFTDGTEHFAHAEAPAQDAVAARYDGLRFLMEALPARLRAIDAAEGGALDVASVGHAIRDALALPRGTRPSRVFVDGQRKGVEAVDAVRGAKQASLLERLGLGGLLWPRGGEKDDVGHREVDGPSLA